MPPDPTHSALQTSFGDLDTVNWVREPHQDLQSLGKLFIPSPWANRQESLNGKRESKTLPPLGLAYYWPLNYMTWPSSLILFPVFRWFLKNYQYVLALLFTTEVVNKNSHFPIHPWVLISTMPFLWSLPCFGSLERARLFYNLQLPETQQTRGYCYRKNVRTFSWDWNASGALQKPTAKWAWVLERDVLLFPNAFSSLNQKKRQKLCVCMPSQGRSWIVRWLTRLRKRKKVNKCNR